MLRSVLTALVCLTVAAPLCLDTVVAAPKWKKFGALKIIVSDQVDANGAIYFAGGQFLVDPSEGDHLYLIAPKDYSVRRVAASAVSSTDGVPGFDPATAELDDLGVLEKDGGTMKWKDGDLRYALSAKPPLLGEVDLATLRDHTDKYEYGIETYTPRRAAVTTIAGVDAPTEIVVGFGVWCPVCADWLPRFIKTLLEADNDHIEMRFVSINEDLDQPADLMETYGFEGVPVFSVRRDGKEIARIDGEELENEQPLIEEWLASRLPS